MTVEDEDFGTLDMRQIEPGMYHINMSIPVTVEKPVGEIEVEVRR